MVYQSLDTSSSPNRSSSSGHKSSNSNSQSQSTNTQAHKSSRVHEPEEHRMEGSPPSPTDSAMGMMAATTRAEASPYLATLPVTLSDVREMTRQNPLYGASPVKVSSVTWSHTHVTHCQRGVIAHARDRWLLVPCLPCLSDCFSECDMRLHVMASWLTR